MGELAKALVALSGPDSVLGIIPGALLGVERGGDEGGAAKEGRRRGWVEMVRGWGALGGRAGGGAAAGEGQLQDTTAASALLSESVYGRTVIVRDLAARKRRMVEEIAGAGPGSGFVALSGGFGTLDEVMEVVTGWQMGVHGRGVCSLNVEGFWDGLVAWMEGAVGAGFVREEGREVLVERGSPEECVEWLRERDGGWGRWIR